MPSVLTHQIVAKIVTEPALLPSLGKTLPLMPPRTEPPLVSWVMWTQCAGSHYLRIENAYAYVLIAVYLFICMCVCVCYLHNSKSIKPNRMKFGGIIGYSPGTIWWDFGIDRVKDQGQGHEKVKIFLSNWHATHVKMFIIQCPILWCAKVCALPSARSSLQMQTVCVCVK